MCVQLDVFYPTLGHTWLHDARLQVRFQHKISQEQMEAVHKALVRCWEFFWAFGCVHQTKKSPLVDNRQSGWLFGT